MRGQLKIFLGYAAGVGKTYQMLTEARQLMTAGHDVVVAWFEPHARAETIAQTEGLEFVPRAVYEHRGAAFEDMDTGAVLARRPRIVVVDEFAHTNAPGAPRAKRWQDVAILREAGIDVLTSLNVQHIESLNDQVWQVTGIRVRETIPDWLVREADEVVLVDVTPRALLHRMERGVIYAREKAAAAMSNFFTETNLTALRELAMRQTAHTLDPRPEPASRERIGLWLSPHPATAMLIRRAHRIADYLAAACDALYRADETPLLQQYLQFCRDLHIQTWPVESPLSARSRGVTQLLVTRSTPGLKNLLNKARDLQIIVVAERSR